MIPRAEGFKNEMIVISPCERNLGIVQKPVGTGDASSVSSFSGMSYIITPTAIFIYSMRSKLQFFQFGLQILYQE